MSGPAGLVLTGGASRRMGHPKATLVVDGVANVARVVQALATVATPVIEVGPGHSGLPAVLEDPPGQGPLVAVATGWRALRDQGHPGPVLVLACDLPLVDETVLRRLAEWPGRGSVVPVLAGRAQPLCARWSASDLDAALELAASGQRSLRGLLERPGVAFPTEAEWAPPGTDARRVLADVDRPEDLAELGLPWAPGPS